MPPAGPGPHLATLSHGGRFWDVYLELEEARVPGEPFRGRLVFSPADAADGEAPLRTALILIEPTPEAALRRARELSTHQLLGLLRSCMA